jgi:hypothetical protein
MGRADMFEFILFNKTDWTLAQSARIPFADDGDFAPAIDSNSIIYVWSNAINDWAIALEKDNREMLSFNYQLMLNHDVEFRTFPNLFGVKESVAKIALIDSEVSMFDESIGFVNTLLVENISFTPALLASGAIRINFTISQNVVLDNVKSVVIYYEDKYANKYAIMARNVGTLENDKKGLPWFIYPVLNKN